MIAVGVNQETGETYKVDSDEIDREYIESMSIFRKADTEIKKQIDNLDISADAKSLLYAFSSATIKAGEYIVKIGRKIIDYVCRILDEFPNTSFGMVFGAIAGFLVSSIPLLGVVLGPLVAPILMAFGLFGGLMEDLKDKALARKISEINGKFTPLRA
ncbi:permease [Thiohalobacter thiocyanaticus]|uniref:Permease n=1 Tax=Thiohalobacter thiocyanaticus TaxID=585455 RepID=A0A1Z4VRE4_9GAMM|nr:hypothetical protein [Thiohalobacter thiocyanaticus]BAZ94201.1 permease [Thiohalobacter thiocyanaticus]